jgi:hypothetical protein
MNDNFVTKDAPRRAIVWTLEVELEAEALAVVGDRGLQILHDEGRPDRREISIRLFALPAVRSGVGRVRAHGGIHHSVASSANDCFDNLEIWAQLAAPICRLSG